MALTATQLRARLLFNLKNDTNFGTEASPDTLNTYLTLGQQRIVRDSPHTLGTKSLALAMVITDQQLALSATFFQMIKVTIPALARTVEFIPHDRFLNEVFSSTIPSGAPRRYSLIFDFVNNVWNIAFDHISDASYTINYAFYQMPADISGSTVPPVSAIGFAELLIWAATMIARENFDPDGAREAQTHYMAGLERYRAYHPGSPDWVVTPPIPMYPGGSTLTLDDSRFEW